MNEEELKKLESSIHRNGTLAHILLPIGIATTIGFFVGGLTFNLIAALALDGTTKLAKVFYDLSSTLYGVIGTIGLPCLIAGIVFRKILEKRKAAHPDYQDKVDDFNIY